ncbi:cytochrome b/b6 domain-containing protein [Falsiroseomonas sp. HW251]|uniref:cytochrome b/b6 domain-containing protein n=1 Tax=Falsiroseomonas sp. HW251 TaxID=3390998 RepID=UPI003D31B48C
MDGRHRLKVWDPWVRLVHWAIVLLLPLQFWSAKTARFDLHVAFGYAMLALVAFRIAWGVVGSDTARFSHFLRSPAAALEHLRHVGRREAPVDVGHNAAGGWMVLALLLLLLTQAVTGLFADDGVLTRGPLAHLVGGAWNDRATAVHVRVFWVIAACAVLHVLAVLAYRKVLGRNLVAPMVTGSMEVPPGMQARAPRMGNPALAVALLAAAGGLVWWISTLKPASLFD